MVQAGDGIVQLTSSVVTREPADQADTEWQLYELTSQRPCKKVISCQLV